MPSVVVRTALEALADPHLRASGAIQKLSHPDAGEIEAVGSGIPIRMSDAKVGLHRPAPKLGADNQDVYGRLLGLGQDEIERLAAEKII